MLPTCRFAQPGQLLQTTYPTNLFFSTYPTNLFFSIIWCSLATARAKNTLRARPCLSVRRVGPDDIVLFIITVILIPVVIVIWCSSP
jgi:hypothetical protein